MSDYEEQIKTAAYKNGFGFGLFSTPERHGYTSVNPFRYTKGKAYDLWEVHYEDGYQEGVIERREKVE